MVITARTRNAVTALSGTRVRIPSLPPKTARHGVAQEKVWQRQSSLFLMLLWPLPSFATASGRRNNVAFRFTALTAARHGRTNPFASASYAHPSKVAQPKKGLTKTVMPFFVGCFTRRDTLHVYSFWWTKWRSVPFHYTYRRKARRTNLFASAKKKESAGRLIARLFLCLKTGACIVKHPPKCHLKF